MSRHSDSIDKYQHLNAEEISIRCPYCQQIGIFRVIGVHDVITNESNRTYGQRMCPNPNCNGHLFTIINRASHQIIKTYPGETIPFDTSKIPVRIVNAFTEALISHSNSCYIASAIMIRKTLEEIAEDKKVKGDTLFKKLNEVGRVIILPKELLEAMQELRLLGNDAAHIESKTFEEVGKEEVEISIEFTKEILKATYQYEDLLGKLRSLKNK